MEKLDYYTIMESRINYYACKYDPQNKLGKIENLKLIKNKVEPVSPPIADIKTPVRKRLRKKFDSVIAIFL